MNDARETLGRLFREQGLKNGWSYNRDSWEGLPSERREAWLKLVDIVLPRLAAAEKMAEALERADAELDDAAHLAMQTQHSLSAEGHRLVQSAIRTALAAYREAAGK